MNLNWATKKFSGDEKIFLPQLSVSPFSAFPTYLRKIFYKELNKFMEITTVPVNDQQMKFIPFTLCQTFTLCSVKAFRERYRIF